MERDSAHGVPVRGGVSCYGVAGRRSRGCVYWHSVEYASSLRKLRRTHGGGLAGERTDVAKCVNKRDRTVHSPRPASCSRCVSLDESDYLTHDGRKREGKESVCLTLSGTSRLRAEAKSLAARCMHPCASPACVMLSFCT
jgi:hypothetical protein